MGDDAWRERVPGLSGLLLLEEEAGALLCVSIVILLEEHTPRPSLEQHVHRGKPSRKQGIQF